MLFENFDYDPLNTLLLIHSVQTSNIIKLLLFPVSKIANINLGDFELDEDVLVLVLGGSTLIMPQKYNGRRSSGQVEDLLIKSERVYM